VIKRLGYSRCRLALAVPQAMAYESVSDLQGLRIATTYAGLLGKFLADAEIDAQIVAMKGSVEVAPRLALADVICDLVSTGATLEANGLKAVETVMESEAVLIGTSRDFSDEKAGTSARLLTRIDGVLASAETKYIMLNAPLSALPKIKALLPGAGAPTVMPLEGCDDKVAVHAVCRESVFWETMEQLKEAGASAILVVPIEKMMA
jgi:ATP phosphoribosyltransferase